MSETVTPIEHSCNCGAVRKAVTPWAQLYMPDKASRITLHDGDPLVSEARRIAF